MPPNAQMPFVVTSPTLMHGPAVRDAQRALTFNPFRDFEPGPIDGEYGPMTARATVEAKKTLGYDPDAVNPIYGRFLHAFLTEHAELTEPMKKRREKRRAMEGAESLGERAFKALASKEGLREDPEGSNNILFSRWYMRNPEGWRSGGPPHCAMAVSWAYVEAGSQAFKQGERWAYCPYLWRDAQAGNYGLRVVTTPKRGDLVLFEWGDSGASEPDHVGLFDSPAEGANDHTLESNVQNMVRGETRSHAVITCYVRVTR